MALICEGGNNHAVHVNVHNDETAIKGQTHHLISVLNNKVSIQ